MRTITFKLNSVFSDSTPLTLRAIRAAWTIYRNPDDGYNVIAAPSWRVASSTPWMATRPASDRCYVQALAAGTLGLGLHPH